MAEAEELRVAAEVENEKVEAIQITAAVEVGKVAKVPTKKSVTIASEVSVAEVSEEKPRARKSTSMSDCQNGEDYLEEYDDLELEEPFSTSEDEDETAKKPTRPTLSLPLPRKRIRTLSGTVMPVGYCPHWGGPTMCLSCLEFFDLPREVDKYTTHLIEQHHIVISDIHLIVDLKRYVEHWRNRFSQSPIEKVFPVVIVPESDPLKAKVSQYYLMSEKVKEDLRIRERLALRRLEEVLSCQQREREDRTFSRGCLFCRYKVKGNRAKLIHHLYTIHHLNLGSPDNLVFVNEYLDLLKKKLDNFQCLYCEKIFPDHPTLMDHMRKKNHREVNPKNNYYDKFYVINYLELGKRWLDVLAEDFEDSMPTFVDSEDEEEEETWEEWMEDNNDENDTTVMCLFCDESHGESVKLLEHMKETHLFDFVKIVKDERWEVYQQIKFLNYIRKLTHNRVCFVCGKDDLGSWQALRKHVDGDHLKSLPLQEKWDQDEFLLPTYENDYLLCSIPQDPTPDTNEPFVTFFQLDEVENGGAAGNGSGENGVDSAVPLVPRRTSVHRKSRGSEGGNGRKSPPTKHRYAVIWEDPPLIGDELAKDPIVLE